MLSQKLDSLERPELEELSQQLFLALKRSEGRLMALRREAGAAQRAGGEQKVLRRNGAPGSARPVPRGQSGPVRHGIVRAQSGPVGYQALPEVFKRLSASPGLDETDSSGQGFSIDVTQVQQVKPSLSRSVTVPSMGGVPSSMGGSRSARQLLGSEEQ